MRTCSGCGGRRRRGRRWCWGLEDQLPRQRRQASERPQATHLGDAESQRLQRALHQVVCERPQLRAGRRRAGQQRGEAAGRVGCGDPATKRPAPARSSPQHPCNRTHRGLLVDFFDQRAALKLADVDRQQAVGAVLEPQQHHVAVLLGVAHSAGRRGGDQLPAPAAGAARGKAQAQAASAPAGRRVARSPPGRCQRLPQPWGAGGEGSRGAGLALPSRRCAQLKQAQAPRRSLRHHGLRVGMGLKGVASCCPDPARSPRREAGPPVAAGPRQNSRGWLREDAESHGASAGVLRQRGRRVERRDWKVGAGLSCCGAAQSMHCSQPRCTCK